jgi:hypothetical protein
VVTFLSAMPIRRDGMRTNSKATKPGEQTLLQKRILGLHDAAEYTGLSYWTLRELFVCGKIPSILIPNPKFNDGRSLRRILIDRKDLDDFIDACKVR